MKDFDMIQEQIQHMRTKGVEPELISMSKDMHRALGKPLKLYGVDVDCDDKMRVGFEVR